MNTIKLTDKELEIIKDMLIEKIRYKGVQKLMVNIQNQLQEQMELIRKSKANKQSELTQEKYEQQHYETDENGDITNILKEDFTDTE